MIFHLQFYVLLAVITHTGFDQLFLENRNGLSLINFHHQMHLHYFECNYGSLDVPRDIFFGSFLDGKNAAHDKMLTRLKRFDGKNKAARQIG